jgi:hypothetical protein
MVLFTHVAPNKYVKNIIKDNKIKSFRQTKKVGLGEGLDMMNPDVVFLTIIFDYYKIAIPDYSKSTYFFFDKSVLFNNIPLHYCNSWEWGKLTENCIKYYKSKSTDDNIKIWSDSYKSAVNVNKRPEQYIFGPLQNFNGVQNEVVFKDNVNFNSLVGIYSYDAKWKHPLLMTKPSELKDFFNKYNIFDIDSNPKKHYYIDFSINWNEEKHKQIRHKWLKWASTRKYHSSQLKKWQSTFNRNKTRKIKK